MTSLSFVSDGSMMRNKLVAQEKISKDLMFYLGVYIGISVVICICGASRYFFIFCGSLKASRRLFDKLTYSILRAPLRWLDTVPVGRILNRFTADFVVVDSKMGNDLVSKIEAVITLEGKTFTISTKHLSPEQGTCYIYHHIFLTMKGMLMLSLS